MRYWGWKLILCRNDELGKGRWRKEGLGRRNKGDDEEIKGWRKKGKYKRWWSGKKWEEKGRGSKDYGVYGLRWRKEDIWKGKLRI